VTIEFGNFDNGNEIGNVETSFGEVAAPTGGDSMNSSENMALEENVPEHSVEDRLDNLEQLMALMQRQKELRRKEDLEEALKEELKLRSAVQRKSSTYSDVDEPHESAGSQSGYSRYSRSGVRAQDLVSSNTERSYRHRPW